MIDDFLQRHIGFELKGEFDLVTEADRSSERLIVERLKGCILPTRSLPRKAAGKRVHPNICWYVDPLDGTTNFAHGFPVFNVTLALERAGELIAGVVFDPTRNEMFSAEKGVGRVPERPGDSSFERAEN